jgi:branched-chain amino acid transport system substrate-binding protein
MYRCHSAIVLVVAFVCIQSAPALASGRTEHHRGSAARVAVLLDLHGAQASIGRPAMNGFVLGLQQGSEDGPVPYTALFDTRSDPNVTRSAAQEAAASVSLAAGFTDNDSVLIAGPYFERARTAFLSVGATGPTLPETIGNSIFLTPFGDNTQAAAAAEFAQGEFGSWAAILWDSTSEYTRTLPRYFRTRFEELGGTVVLDASYDGGCDIGTLGLEVSALSPKPDFVYLAGLPDCIGAVVASLRAAGVAEPVVGGDGLDTPNLLDVSPNPTDDVWYTTHAWLSQETGTPAAKAFIAAYVDAYGTAPTDAFAALGYDAARLMLDVLGRAKRSRKGIVDSLENTEGFEGVTGTISFSRESHVPLKTVWVIEVHDAERSLAQAFVPDSVPAPVLDEP